MEWFNDLEPLLKIYWVIAIIASLVFVIQMVLAFSGIDSSEGGMDGDVHLDGTFQYFSLRNLVNFFIGFGWGGVCFYQTFESKVWVGICALLTGLFFVAFFFFLIKQFMKLSKDNTFKIEDTVGKVSDVYLVIPGENEGRGKIQISVKGSVHEIDAMTEGDKIPTGSKARVIEVIDNQTVLVIKS